MDHPCQRAIVNFGLDQVTLKLRDTRLGKILCVGEGCIHRGLESAPSQKRPKSNVSDFVYLYQLTTDDSWRLFIQAQHFRCASIFGLEARLA